MLKNLGIEVRDTIPEDTDTIFNGGALTIVADFVKTHKISNLVMNGGFVGANIVPIRKVLPKFAGKSEIRTFNFNCDVNATVSVLESSNIDRIVLIGKNVCHNERNAANGIWRSLKGMIVDEYGVRPSKLMHDLLACHEGLSILKLHDEPLECDYRMVYPYHTGLCGNMTKWGSRDNAFGKFKRVLAAVDWAV